MITRYELAADFVDAGLELSLLAAIVANPEKVYFSVIDSLAENTFAAHAQEFIQIATCIEDRKPLPVIEGLPQPHPDPESAALQLADLYQKRLLAKHGQRFLEELRGEKTASELKDLLEDGLAEVDHAARQLRGGRLTSIADLLPDVFKGLHERYQRAQNSESGYAGLSTGLSSLDQLTGGMSDYLWLLAGPPGMGKTSLALQLASTVARSGGLALFVSHEEGIGRLAAKVIASSADLEFKRFEDGLSDPARLEEAARQHAPGLRTLFFHEGTSKTTVNEVKATFLRAQNRTGCRGPALIVIDYFQKACASLGDGEYRHVLETYLAQVMEQLVKRCNACVLMLAAQNRAGAGTGAISSIRDGGDYTGDVIGLLCDGDRMEAHPKRSVNVVIGKNRRGATGSVALTFDAALGKFTEA